MSNASGKSGKSGKVGRKDNHKRAASIKGIQLRRETIARVQGGVTYQVRADDDDLDEVYEAELESASKAALTMSTQVIEVFVLTH